MTVRDNLNISEFPFFMFFYLNILVVTLVC